MPDIKQEEPDAYIIVMGNPVDGLTFIGPFTEQDDAIAEAENIRDTDYWIAPLYFFVD